MTCSTEVNMSTSLNLVVFGVCLAVCTAILAAESCEDSIEQDIRVRIKTPCSELTGEVGDRKVRRLCNRNTQKVKTGCCQTCAKLLKAEESESCKDQGDFTVTIAKKVNCAEYYKSFVSRMPRNCLKNTKKIQTKCCATCKLFSKPEPTTAPKPEQVKQQIDIVNHPTAQSSHYLDYPGPARQAVDGIEETNYFATACTHTLHEANPWWSVDMKQEVDVTSVELLNRADCCSGRLANVEVLVSDSPFSRTGQYTQCGMFQGHVGSGAWGVVTCDTPTRGRYVTVMLAGTNYLTLCEVKIFGIIEEEINIRNHPTEQSSDYQEYPGPSGQAVDGDLETNYFKTACTHTLLEQDPWWSVDLKRQVDVTRVDLLNRGDCCGARLANVEVVVSDSPFSGNPHYTQCGMFNGHVGSGAWGVVTCNTATRGRYVTVKLPGVDYLTLCEVKVFGR